MTPSLGEDQVSKATTTELQPAAPGRTEVREARHWIERQLRWERVLGVLRDTRTGERTPRAA
jgi:hypothetical protein